jgi:DNA repair protein RecN (Recombination protein N)
LSEKRKKAALELENRIGQELSPLKMELCVWKVLVNQKPDNMIASNGIDDIKFIASTNPGMPLMPIDKIASGGELARLMLAVKLALFDKYTTDTIIFDEIDTGIGGRVADAIGERLLHLSKIAQVIVITHQPQVAAKADYNILITKALDNNNTYSDAKILNKDEKAEEIARMLSGEKVTNKALEAALELIEK